MEREKGEYLAMDEGKRQELDAQAQEYQSDAPAMPSMNADPEAATDDPGAPEAAEATDRVES